MEKYDDYEEGTGTSKHNCLCTCFIRLTTTCFGHCGPSSGHKNYLNEYFHNHTYSQSETSMYLLQTHQRHGHARDTPSFPLSTTNPTWFFHLTWSVQPYICTLNWRHFTYRTSRTRTIRTLILSTLLVENISSIRINRITTRSRWKFTICTTTKDLTLYSFSLLYEGKSLNNRNFILKCMEKYAQRKILFRDTKWLLSNMSYRGRDDHAVSACAVGRKTWPLHC